MICFAANPRPHDSHALIRTGRRDRTRGLLRARNGRHSKQSFRPFRWRRIPPITTVRENLRPHGHVSMADRTLVLSRPACQSEIARRIGEPSRCARTAVRLNGGPAFSSPGRTRTSDLAVTRAPRFPSDVDYLFALTRTRVLGAGRIVSEPSRGVPRAWLRIAMALSRFRFPDSSPSVHLQVSLEGCIKYFLQPLALPLSYRGQRGNCKRQR